MSINLLTTVNTQKVAINESTSQSTTSPAHNDYLTGSKFAAPLAVIWHPACELHNIPNHPERPERVRCILETLRKEFKSKIFFEAPRVTEEQILLFHSKSHLNKLLSSHEGTKARGVVSIDGDTILIPETLEAIYRAAGSIIDAVDKVFSKQFRSVFCAVRPPGHHAERNKMCGFCFLNNAGIGARYAQKKHGVERVAVLDFDVHHGNGTEEGFTPNATLFYGSTHEKDNFPGTGKDPFPFVGEMVKDPLHRRIVNRYLNTGGRWQSEPASVRTEFREKWKEIIDEMVLFRPGFVIISAGFDAHDQDPLASCDLIEEDFEWATELILSACVKIDGNNPPPVVSILEGGYHLEALALSSLAHVKALASGYPHLDEETKTHEESEVDTTMQKQSVTTLSANTTEAFEGETNSITNNLVGGNGDVDQLVCDLKKLHT